MTFFHRFTRQTFTHFLVKKNCNIHVQNEGGGGVKGRLNNVEKTALLARDVGFPYCGGGSEGGHDLEEK